ncbi:MAG: hypothetical protein LUF01_03415 [Bacteroides sp.]|nr:hypothetical protein [Bacteroides sp.]
MLRYLGQVDWLRPSSGLTAYKEYIAQKDGIQHKYPAIRFQSRRIPFMLETHQRTRIVSFSSTRPLRRNAARCRA